MKDWNENSKENLFLRHSCPCVKQYPPPAVIVGLGCFQQERLVDGIWFESHSADLAIVSSLAKIFVNHFEELCGIVDCIIDCHGWKEIGFEEFSHLHPFELSFIVHSLLGKKNWSNLIGW